MEHKQRILGFVGWSGCGKTHLITRVIPELKKRDLTVSTMKRTHHDVNLDTNERKDSCKHRAAGSYEVVLASSKRFAVMHELNEEAEYSPEMIAQQLRPVDIVLAEGFKAFSHDKIEVFRRANPKKEGGGSLMCIGDSDGKVSGILAVATDDPSFVKAKLAEAKIDIDIPVLDMNDEAAVSEFITAYLKK